MEADWISFEEARRLVLESVPLLDAEECPLQQAVGRVLAQQIVAPVDLPLWANSAMDGFAVHCSAIRGASRATPVDLPVTDDVPAGSFPRGRLDEGTAARVMTGAPVPDGADSVIRVEHTDGGRGIGGENAPGRVRIFSDEDAGRNIRQKGEDVRRDTVVFTNGDVLSPAVAGVAASLGYAKVRVVRRPTVALLTSGDELVEVADFGEVLAGRKIVSSNSYALAAQLAETGCTVRYLGIARDTPESLREAIRRAEGCDALLTSAGVSVGEHDYVKAVLEEFGTKIGLWRVRIKPGSPFAFGRIQRLSSIPWFGLPGNPVSSMVTFELFARPALLRMSGRSRVYRRPVQARLEEPLTAPAGLTQFVRVRLEQDSRGSWTARPTGPQGSGILSSVAAADGLLVIPEDRAGARAGEVLSVIPFDSALMTEAPD